MSEKIEIAVEAIDNASDKISQMCTNMQGSYNKIAEATDKVETSTKKIGTSARDLTLDFSHVATGAMNLYNSYDRYNEAQLRVDRANLQVSKSNEALEKAQKAYDDALKDCGVDSDKVAKLQLDLDTANLKVKTSTSDVNDKQEAYNKALAQYGSANPKTIKAFNDLEGAQLTLKGKTNDATDAQNTLTTTLAGTNNDAVQKAFTDLGQAQDQVKIKADAASQANEDLKKTIVNAFIQGGPAVISMTDGIIKTVKDFGGEKGAIASVHAAIDVMKGKFEALNNISFAGLASNLSVIAPYMGLLMLVPEAIKEAPPVAEQVTAPALSVAKKMPSPEAYGKLGISGPEEFAERVKVFAKYYGLNPADVAREYGGLYGWSAADMTALLAMIAKMQVGGIVTRPTMALIGEAGPEAVVPLNRMGSAMQTINNNININVEGSVDERTLRVMEKRLKSVLVEPSSSRAPATQKRIRRGSIFP